MNATTLPLTAVFEAWHDFYTLLGAAAATLVGLLFVAATVGAGVFSSSRRAASRVFLSASVVHFTSLLAACLFVLAPGQSWQSLGGMILACGLFGLGYYGLTWWDMMRDGLSKRIDLDDRVWYAVVPAILYLLEAGVGVALALQWSLGCAALALCLGTLLLVGIHNAWDITLWSITRPRD